MNKVCEFSIWSWLLLLSVMLIILGSILVALGEADNSSTAEAFGITFIVIGSLMFITSPCTYFYMSSMCHWMDHCYPGHLCDICEESRGDSCQDEECWIKETPWKCVCFCVPFTTCTTHVHSHRIGQPCPEDQDCWIRNLQGYFCCCSRDSDDESAPMMQMQLGCRGCICNCNIKESTQVVPLDPNPAQNHPSAPQEGADDCVICMDAPKCTLILPCAHVATCENCIQELMNMEQPCPICRGTITRFQRVYT